MSHSGEPVEWESASWRTSEASPGVKYRTVKMTLARRAELTRKVGEALKRAQFHAASGELTERLEAAALAAESDRALLDWGLLELTGLRIDGEAATVRSLIEHGPEELCREIAAWIRRECRLTDDERKN